MTDPTPTRDEAPDVLAKQVTAAASDMCEIARIAGEWRNGPKQSLTAIREIRAVLASAPAPASGGVDAVIRYYADTFCELGSHHECCGKLNKDECSGCLARSALASAPAPASGRVDAVARRAKYLLNRLETDDGLGIGEIDTMLRMAASLSPAATPVSEAGGEATGKPSLQVADIPRALNTGRYLAETNDGRLLYLNHANEWQEMPNILAKPASSPAPVRPIGNQGISDYQREIARNMAEGFAAWNAARQEALPSDEPASSPAGGDVVEALNWTERQLRAAKQAMVVSANQGNGYANFAAHDAHKHLSTIRAALSQSTSAGRVGE